MAATVLPLIAALLVGLREWWFLALIALPFLLLSGASSAALFGVAIALGTILLPAIFVALLGRSCGGKSPGALLAASAALGGAVLLPEFLALILPTLLTGAISDPLPFVGECLAFLATSVGSVMVVATLLIVVGTTPAERRSASRIAVVLLPLLVVLLSAIAGSSILEGMRQMVRGGPIV